MEAKTKKLISVDDALELITQTVIPLDSHECSLSNAFSCILGADVTAQLSLPPFDQSAMDGYAVRYSDFTNEGLIVNGEVPAGIAPEIKLGDNEAIRIFTGAMIPDGADTVIIQENVEVRDGKIYFDKAQVVKGQNIRVMGAQINTGEVALKKGARLTPGAVGYLGALGVREVVVGANPSVQIIVTGSELVQAGCKLEPGQIYESNSIALVAALHSFGVKNPTVRIVRDDAAEIQQQIDEAISTSNVVLITGGVSVGDYDFTGSALAELGVENIFYKVAQKPGKPLFFGRKNKTLVFGLPGNPASVLSCFYEYVTPAIRLLTGSAAPHGLPKVQLPLAENLNKKAGLAHFLKAKLSGGSVHILQGQESFILSSFAEADCLVRIPAEAGNLEKGAMVECHILPF